MLIKIIIGGLAMKTILKQEGYTLLLTLVLTVLLFLITATLSITFINQNKQVAATDSSFVATSVAEMGIEYYHQTISKILIDELENSNDDFTLILNSTSTNSEKVLAINNRIKSIESNVAQSITNLKTSSVPILVDDVDNQYVLSDVIYNKELSTIKFSVISTILNENKNISKEIQATLSVPKIAEYQPSQGTGNGDGSNNETKFPFVSLPVFTESYISDNPNCKTTNPNNINCTAVSGQSYSKTKNSKIYFPLTNLNVSGPFENTDVIFSGNLNQTIPINGSLKGLSIFTNGSAKFNSSIEGDHLVIFSKKDLTLHGINNQNNSKLTSLETITIENPISSSQLTISAKKVFLNNINSPSHSTNKSYFNAVEQINFLGTIDGNNIVVSSPDVSVKGTINGDVEINAQNLTLHSNVSGSLTAVISNKLYSPNSITIGLGSNVFINEIDASTDKMITFEGKNKTRSSKVCVNVATVESISRLKGTGNTEIHINGPHVKKMPNSSHFKYYSSPEEFNKICESLKPQYPSNNLDLPDVLPVISDLDITEILYN